MKAYSLRVVALSSFVVAGACAGTAGGPSGPGVKIQTAPLTLPSVGEVCYGITVYNGDPDAGEPDTVWSEAGICSGTYGDGGGGAITYIGTCDASVENDNYIALVLESVTDENDVVLDDQITTNAVGGDGDADFQNPCPAGAPCTLHFECLENADVLVEFDLAIMRDAQQGFFDVAVNFGDIFCSMKFDSCYDDGEGDDITLLFGDSAGESGVVDGDGRDHTAVFGLACTAGTGDAIDTSILYSSVQVTCPAPVGTFSIPLVGQDQGNHSVMLDLDGNASATHALQYGLYFGNEQLDCGTETVQTTVTTPGTVVYQGQTLPTFNTGKGEIFVWDTLVHNVDATFSVFTVDQDGQSVPGRGEVLGAEPNQTLQITNSTNLVVYPRAVTTSTGFTTQPKSCNKVFYNIAIDLEDLPAGCTLSLEATAQDENDPKIDPSGVIAKAGSTYPFVHLTNAALSGCFAFAPGEGPLSVDYGTSAGMSPPRTAAIMCASTLGGIATALPETFKNGIEAGISAATAIKVDTFGLLGRVERLFAAATDPCTGAVGPVRAMEKWNYFQFASDYVGHTLYVTSAQLVGLSQQELAGIGTKLQFELGFNLNGRAVSLGKVDYATLRGEIDKSGFLAINSDFLSQIKVGTKLYFVARLAPGYLGTSFAASGFIADIGLSMQLP